MPKSVLVPFGISVEPLGKLKHLLLRLGTMRQIRDNEEDGYGIVMGLVVSNENQSWKDV